MMKIKHIFLLALFAVSLSSCDVILGIFEAGAWVGAIIVVLIVVLIAFVIRKLTGGKRNS